MKPTLFIKFGEKHHLERLQKEGNLYCNTITYFSKIEDNARKDSFETVTKTEYHKKPFFQLKPANDTSAEWKSVNVLNALYKEYYDEVIGNLFCMSAFKLKPIKEATTVYFDKRFFEFWVWINNIKTGHIYAEIESCSF
jgi:hypothetical protein